MYDKTPKQKDGKIETFFDNVIQFLNNISIFLNKHRRTNKYTIYALVAIAMAIGYGRMIIPETIQIMNGSMNIPQEDIYPLFSGIGFMLVFIFIMLMIMIMTEVIFWTPRNKRTFKKTIKQIGICILLTPLLFLIGMGYMAVGVYSETVFQICVGTVSLFSVLYVFGSDAFLPETDEEVPAFKENNTLKTENVLPFKSKTESEK